MGDGRPLKGGCYSFTAAMTAPTKATIMVIVARNEVLISEWRRLSWRLISAKRSSMPANRCSTLAKRSSMPAKRCSMPAKRWSMASNLRLTASKRRSIFSASRSRSRLVATSAHPTGGRCSIKTVASSWPRTSSSRRYSWWRDSSLIAMVSSLRRWFDSERGPDPASEGAVPMVTAGWVGEAEAGGWVPGGEGWPGESRSRRWAAPGGGGRGPLDGRREDAPRGDRSPERGGEGGRLAGRWLLVGVGLRVAGAGRRGAHPAG